MSDEQTCVLCGKRLAFQWTDTHGVAIHIYCGMPYRLYHYEGDKRIEKGPEPIPLKDGWLEIGRRYHEETGRRAFPACFDMGFFSRSEATYSGATRSDTATWNEWLDSHRDELP